MYKLHYRLINRIFIVPNVESNDRVQCFHHHLILASRTYPDTCFGLLKQKFRRTDDDSLDNFANVVNQSAMVNTSQLVGTANGEVIVPTYDWTSYFATLYKKKIGIKKYHHFNFDATSSGK